MATWKKIVTVGEQERQLVLFKRCKTGYRYHNTSIDMYRYFWNMNGASYGNEYYQRLGIGAGAYAADTTSYPITSQLPDTIAYTNGPDWIVPYKCTVPAGGKVNISWGTGFGNTPSDDTIFYFSFTKCAATDWHQNEESNNLPSPVAEWPETEDSSNANKAGIIEYDIGDTSYTQGDTTYGFYKSHIMENDWTLNQGDCVWFLVTNDEYTSSVTQKYMYNMRADLPIVRTH